MKKLLPLLFALTGGLPLRASVTLPPLISDNMLLQQPKAAIWGKADPGERVSVSFWAVSVFTTADKDGNWRVELDGLKPGTVSDLKVKGKNTIVIHNVAVGEVWLASGQSNMQFPVKKAKDAGEEIAAARFPEIRMFTVPLKTSPTPLAQVEGKWEVCTPETVREWSAVGYFFARALHGELKAPVGILHSSWGGTPGEAWTPREVFMANPEFQEKYLEGWKRRVATYPAIEAQYNKELAQWKIDSAAAKAAGHFPALKPEPPLEDPPREERTPSFLYNAMIQGITPYTIRGTIWYQGESNVRDTSYQPLLSAMIASWRKAWNLGDFPFLIVQIANYLPPQHRQALLASEPLDSREARLRDAQRLVATSVPHTGLAVTLDIGDPNNIHPTNKQDVGHRLALIAEATVYGRPVVYSGPFFEKATFTGSEATVRFKAGTAAGLKTRDGRPVQGFAVAGEDRHFVWAEAKIVPQVDGAEPGIVVTAPKEVPHPVALRYAWADSPEVNLVNGADLPASSFRTDNWPLVEKAK